MPSPFWSAYSAAVKQHLVPGVTLPKDNEVFALPFTVPFTTATGPLTDEGANDLVYNLANTTLAADGTKGNYVQELNTYLNTVDQGSLQDPTQEKELEEAEKNLENAKTALQSAEADARAQYDLFPPPKPPFEQWVVQNWPPYNAAQRNVTSAQSQRDQAYNRYWARIVTLRGYLDNLVKALDTRALHQSYNMSVGDSTFKPSYSSFGFKDQLNRWIQGGGQEQTFVDVKVDSATPPGYEVEGDIYLKLTTKGVAKIDILTGQWDVPGVKTLYPERVPGAPNVLDPKYARPISALVAYDPILVVEVRENGETTKSKSPSTADDKPYVAVFGILGQHFPPS